MDEEVEAARQRVAERERIRKASAERGRGLPANFQRRLNNEFKQAARKAQMLTRMNHTGYND